MWRIKYSLHLAGAGFDVNAVIRKMPRKLCFQRVPLRVALREPFLTGAGWVQSRGRVHDPRRPLQQRREQVIKGCCALR